MTARPDRSAAAEFQDPDVVAAYVHRPDYPAALYARLLDLMPAPGCVLDLGCGPGKIARALSPHVHEVLAVDPSPAMLALGQALDAGAHGNIRWIESAAEDLRLEAGLDLAVAGAAIHWMDPARIFPKLASALAPGAVVALVEGDAPTEAPWLAAYQQVIEAWVVRLGGVWKGEAHRALTTAHLTWLDIQGREVFAGRVRQPLEDLIACQHSRATWARARMGPEAAQAFDADLRTALDPWAEAGMLAFEVRSTVVWGQARSVPSSGRP